MTLGWYAGRMGALAGLSVMTVVYLRELKNAYLESLACARQRTLSDLKRDSEVHERSLYAEKLVQADHHKDQFLAMLAHELRNPLAPISAAAELLVLGNLSSEKILLTSGIIVRQIKHLTGLVDDLLDVSRVTTALIEIDRVQVDVKQVIAEAIEQARPQSDALRHQLSVELTPEPTSVTGDHRRLVQVVANLLGNAVKFTPRNGRISVCLTATEAHIMISVVDNGIGIPALLLPDVFKLFTQGERTLSRAQGGLGLGLAIVKSLVELHSGTVSVQCLKEGFGSEFMICLPRVLTADNLSSLGEPLRATRSVVHSKASILVVDDNVDAAQMLGEFLKAKGFKVVVEHDAHGALKRAKDESFDAFFLDIGMPGTDGLELVQRLRALLQTKSGLMVAVTGYASKADKASFVASGFDEHLVKPATPEKILEVLQRIRFGGPAGGECEL